MKDLNILLMFKNSFINNKNFKNIFTGQFSKYNSYYTYLVKSCSYSTIYPLNILPFNPKSTFSTYHSNSNFFSSIPTNYISSQNKPIHLFFNLFDLDDSSLFRDIILNNIGMDSIYTVFIKVRYNQDSFFMVGNQFGFSFKSTDDIDNLLSDIKSRLDDYLDDYNLTDDSITYIQVSFKSLDVRLFSEFKLNKPIHVSINDFNNTYRKLNIPVSINSDSLGKPLDIQIVNNVITDIVLIYKNKRINFMDVIKDKAKFLAKSHKDNITIFDSNYKFYLIKDIRYFILGVRIIDSFTIEKIRYSLDGVIINRVIDSLNNNFIIRKTGGKEIIINNNNVIDFIKQDISLKPIPKPSFKSNPIPNPNIGVIDTETYLDNDNTNKIYALGFKTNLDDKPVIYYLNEQNLNSDDIILSLVDELLRPKYNNIIFYCHNLGGFDIVFILNTLYKYNDDINNIQKYKISPILRDDKIIKVKISKGKHSFSILDSYSMLTSSLAKLGKSFEVDTLKSYFPYKFSTKDHLFYKGDTPNVIYYENISLEEYNKLYSNNWSFKDETIKYLENDLNSLYEILVKANRQVFKDYGVDITDNITISGLAVRILLKDYYNNNIPVINKSSIYRDIKQAYYGGMTEVYKPYGENLYYYDVNSLYPYVALQDMPGLICSKLQFFNDKQTIDNLFGFFYCRIETPINSYLGLLPVRNKNGIDFPLGKWEGWYFSEELKFAKNNDYKITVLKGYEFNKETNVFKDYINKIYSIKSNPINNTQKSMAKSLLNNLLGRFGINLEKPITDVVSTTTFEKYSVMYKIISYKHISNNKILISYIPKLDKDIIDSHDLDILKILTKYKDHEVQNLNTTSIVISAAITAYGRIHMNKLKLDILNKGGEIYYSDTDSIVTNIKLPDTLVSKTELGKLKLEHLVARGVFINSKVYCLIDEKGNFINRAKGVKSSSLTYSDYLTLLNNQNINTAVKVESKINWKIGDVKINSKNISINSNSYNKRSKIFDLYNWIDTRPLFINTLDTSLIVYNNNKSIILYNFINSRKQKFIPLPLYPKDNLSNNLNNPWGYLKLTLGILSIFAINFFTILYCIGSKDYDYININNITNDIENPYESEIDYYLDLNIQDNEIKEYLYKDIYLIYNVYDDIYDIEEFEDNYRKFLHLYSDGIYSKKNTTNNNSNEIKNIEFDIDDSIQENNTFYDNHPYNIPRLRDEELNYDENIQENISLYDNYINNTNTNNIILENKDKEENKSKVSTPYYTPYLTPVDIYLDKINKESNNNNNFSMFIYNDITNIPQLEIKKNINDFNNDLELDKLNINDNNNNDLLLNTQLSPNIDNQSPSINDKLSPNSYELLKDTINITKANIENIENISKDKEILFSVKEKLLDEKHYLLELQAKHLKATEKVLEQLKSESHFTDNSNQNNQIINTNENNSSSNLNNEIYNVKDIEKNKSAFLNQISNNNQLNTELNSEKNESISNSPLSPVTLVYLNDEIQNNETNLKNPNLDIETREKLMDERRYLLDQKINHLNAVVKESN